MLPGYDYLTAHFVDEAKTQISTYWIDPKNPDAVIEETIEMDDEHPVYQELLQHTTLDEIHENTVIEIREQRAGFQKMVLDIAKHEGLISDLITSEDNLYQVIANTVFQDFDPATQAEALFSFKLTLFEQEWLKNSDDREGKAALRKAESYVEAMKIAIEIYEKQ